MTLFRQLVVRVAAISIVVALVLLPLSCYWLADQLQLQQQQESSQQLQRFRLQLQQQWQRDQAFDLSLLASPSALALFHSIRIEADGNNLNQRFTTAAQYPALVSALPLFSDTPLQARIDRDALPTATLFALSNSGRYYQLWWQQTAMLSVMVLLWLLLALLAISVGVKRQLAPLLLLSQRAEDLSRLKFSLPLAVPESQELGKITNAINALAKKLKWELDGYHKQVDTLKRALLTDQVSELPNRAFIVERIDSWLREAEAGVLVLINMKFLEDVRLKFGFEYRDELVANFSRKVRELVSSQPGLLAARISAEDFLIVVSSADYQQAVNALQQLTSQTYKDSDLNISAPYGVGVVQKHLQGKAEEILAQADNALVQAITAPDQICWYQQPAEAPLFRQQWRNALTQAVHEAHFRFVAHPVVDAAGDRIQLDLDIELDVNGRLMSEQELLPYLKMLSLANDFEKSKIRAAADLEIKFTPVVFNLVPQSVEDPEFGRWLSRFLQQKEYAFQFEISERQVLAAPDAVKRLRSELKNLGYKLGVNHFGMHLVELDYISWLRPDYVKLDPAFSAMPHSPMQAEMCRTMFNTLQTLNISLYLADIPNEEALTQFASMPYNGFKRLGDEMLMQPKAEAALT
ncbi:EAL domain-containing protein [uncultured Ferrimonas sp.]|uniref:EAL domain-containing protein n=1 Tax=uncultured Ferrimonas sp. TaxID=432640 RepID=UPI0026221147|nr:EAL domain-containing protein [uncultured Ferrimonas sp.]